MSRERQEADRDPPRADEPLAASTVEAHYRSVDSAPLEYSVDRPPAAVNGALVVFTALSILVLTVVTVLVRAGVLVDSRDVVFLSSGGERAAVPVRVFLITFFVAVACSLATDRWRRTVVAIELVGGLLLVCAAVDLASYAARVRWGLSVDVGGQQLVSALAGLALFPLTLMWNAHLPAATQLSTRGRVRWHAWWRLLLPLCIGFAVAAWAEQSFAGLVSWMRDHALLGGLGPGVFLVQQVFALLTSLIGLVVLARSRRRVFAPPLAVLVPAHDEAHDIEMTIAAVDGAAARYEAPVHLYVVDNASTDDTVAITSAALDRCPHLTGTVLQCREPGKAVALNLGLRSVREDFVVRIDADTVIGERCLETSLRHFASDDVGAVGGLPLPPDTRGFFNRVRTVEVLVRHGFFQVSLTGYDGVVGEPGMFVVYRRAAFEEAGLLVQGMNGEDTDICLRFTSAGYRSLTDPLAVYRSEVPRTWAHMREQRTRWFRSIYHVAAHNREALFDRHTMAGSVVVPFQLLNAARRAMLLPLLLFGVLVLAVFGPTFPGLRTGPLVASFLGLPMLVAIAVCLGLGRPRAVLYVPEYLVFRLVRSYFTLAAVLSLAYPPLGRPGHGRRPDRADPDGTAATFRSGLTVVRRLTPNG